MTIKKNVKLAPFTTFKIGGPAEYFVQVHNLEEMKEALALAKQKKLAYFILGQGSNILIPDQGLSGLVIHNKFNLIEKQGTSLIVASGCLLSQVLDYSQAHHLSGLEWSFGIPGTIGGAIWTNAGTKDNSLAKILEKVYFIDFNSSLRLKSIENKDCQFDYRKSLFMEKPWIICQAKINLEKSNSLEIKKKIEEFRKKRTNQPKLASAGCIFKNIKIDDLSSESLKKIEKEFPEVKQFYNEGIIPAGWLVDRLDFKGRTIGQAQVSTEHANFIVNLGKATADNVMTLISLIKYEARARFYLQLFEEITILKERHILQEGLSSKNQS